MADDVTVNVSLTDFVKKLRHGEDLLSVMALKDLNLDLDVVDHRFAVKHLDIVLNGTVNVAAETREEDGGAT